jgi:hypothetical protein
MNSSETPFTPANSTTKPDEPIARLPAQHFQVFEGQVRVGGRADGLHGVEKRHGEKA